TNVFLDQKNRWTVPFVPAHVRRYPFLLAQVEGTDQFRLAADIEAPQFASKRKGDTIFTGEGQITEQLNGVVTLITEFEKNMRTGRAVMAELETTGVLVAKDLGFKDGKEQHVIGGFRIVDIEKVEKLDDATLARWVRNGVMSIIHAHLASLRNLSAVALASSRPDAVQ
ncbi:MAG TPA: SapC family protein, partial [Burkholderiaceae bacterium]